MRKFDLTKVAERGSMMVEALAMLGLITMVTPILYKKAAERTTELQDINTATQMRMISSAFDQYVKDNYAALSGEVLDSSESNGKVTLSAAAAAESISPYLPQGFDINNSKLFDELQFAYTWNKVEPTVEGKQPSVSFTTAALAPYREEIVRARSSKIASMIGANGGNYMKEAMPGDDVITAHGVQGIWSIPVSGDDALFDVGNDSKGGLLVISSEAINAAKGDVNSDEVLYRSSTSSDEQRTMEAPLIMAGHPIEAVGQLIAKGDAVTIGANNGTKGNLIVKGVTTLENALTVQEDSTFEKNLTVNQRVTADTFDGETALFRNLITESGSAGYLNVDGLLEANSAKIREGGLEVRNGSIEVYGSGLGAINVHQGDVNLKDGKLNVNGSAFIKTALDVGSAGDQAHLHFTPGSGLQIYGAASGGVASLEFGSGLLRARGTKIQVGSGGKDDLFVVNPEAAYTSFAQPSQMGDSGMLMGSAAVWAGNATLTSVYDLQVRNRLDVVGQANFHDTVNFDKSIFIDGLELKRDGDILTIVNPTPPEDGQEFNTDWIVAKQGFALVAKNRSPRYFQVTQDEFVYRNKINISEAGATFGYDDLNKMTFGSGIDINTPQKLNIKASDIIYTADGSGNTFRMSKEGFVAGGGTDHGGASLLDTTIGDAMTNRITQGYNDGSGTLLAFSNKTGVLEVAPPEDYSDKGHFVRARRFVSDKQYPSNAIFHGFDNNGNSFFDGSENLIEGKKDEMYDYYQVDPAYTSVMNDIKLSSRGGARLSDILPDYINKGIYVVDNTYSDEKITEYPAVTYDGSQKPYYAFSVAGSNPMFPAEFDEPVSSGGYACSERGSNCQASPWLGFIPTPLCPPAYDMAVTINPFRWKMSEIFYLKNSLDPASPTNQNPSWDTRSAENKKKLQQNFDQYFDYYPNPQDTFDQGVAVKDQDNDTNEVLFGLNRPSNYQTNTWLNTAISPYFDGTEGNSRDFMGWHALMGFMYHGTDFAELLHRIMPETDYDSQNIYWNIFPVYAGELAGFATTYCVFNRNRLMNSETGERKWLWGSDGNSPVIPIDQLNEFRKPYDKHETPYLDPQLPYKDAW